MLTNPASLLLCDVEVIKDGEGSEDDIVGGGAVLAPVTVVILKSNFVREEGKYDAYFSRIYFHACMCSVLFSSSWRMMLELDTLAPCSRLTRLTTKAQLSCLMRPPWLRSLFSDSETWSSVFFNEFITNFCIVSVRPVASYLNHLSSVIKLHCGLRRVYRWHLYDNFQKPLNTLSQWILNKDLIWKTPFELPLDIALKNPYNFYFWLEFKNSCLPKW